MQRRIRKQPLLSKLKALPFDLYLFANETRLSIDWEEYSLSVALPLGSSLLLLSLIIKPVINYYNSISSKSSNMIFDSGYAEYEMLKDAFINNRHVERKSTLTASLIWFLNSVRTFIFIVCSINSYQIAVSTKNYGLLYRKTKPNSPSAGRVGNTFLEQVYSYFLKEQASSSDDWQLSIWNPSKFSLYFFIPLNPVNLLLVHDLGNSSALFVIILLLSVSLTLYYLIYSFLNLVQDRQILQLEMLKEYTNKVKTTTMKKDACIDSTLGPYQSFALTNRPYSFQRLKLFVTHDREGKEVREYVGGSLSANTLYLDDSSELLSRLKDDNEKLAARNHELYMEIARLSNQSSFVDESSRANSPRKFGSANGTPLRSPRKGQYESPSSKKNHYPFDSSVVFGG